MIRTDFKKETIIRFYKLLFGDMGFSGFETLSEERIEELDRLCQRWINYSGNMTNGFKSKMNFLAEKLITGYKSNLKLANGDEAAYFYIKTLDPEFKFLEIYELCNKAEDIRKLCMLNFGIYDNKLIMLEKMYNEHSRELDTFDLIERNSIRTQ